MLTCSTHKVSKTRREREYNSIQNGKYGEIQKQTVGVEGFFERGSELMFLLCERRVFWGWGGGGKSLVWYN